MDNRTKVILFLCRFMSYTEAKRLVAWWHEPETVSNPRVPISPHIFDGSATDSQPDDPDLEELFDVDLDLSL